VAAVNNFEQTAADIAADAEYKYVACGHIHQPEIKTLTTAKGEVIYLNSGDWVENLTSLEYTPEVGWQLYYYNQDPSMHYPAEATLDAIDQASDADPAALLEGLLAEFKIR
jgi:hypothetical protein